MTLMGKKSRQLIPMQLLTWSNYTREICGQNKEMKKDLKYRNKETSASIYRPKKEVVVFTGWYSSYQRNSIEKEEEHVDHKDHRMSSTSRGGMR